MLDTWDKLKTFALDLNMPHVTEATAWGNPVLKAHGKMWCWWSPYVEAALFKCPIDERAMLRDADPEMFISHPHYEKHNLVLVAGAHLDAAWAEARLMRTWKELAPKRVLQAWEAEQAGE